MFYKFREIVFDGKSTECMMNKYHNDDVIQI